MEQAGLVVLQTGLSQTEEAGLVVLGVILYGAFFTYLGMGLYWGVRHYHRRHGLSIFANPAQAFWPLVFWGALWPLAFISESYRNPRLCTDSDCVYRRQEVRRESERYKEALREEGREV